MTKLVNSSTPMRTLYAFLAAGHQVMREGDHYAAIDGEFRLKIDRRSVEALRKRNMATVRKKRGQT